ncbi:MAG: shikimate dehydrogenase [Verrucomicrobiota bacterium]
MNEPVLTLADLDGWNRSGTHLAVLGHPIKHSISPPMHNAALAELAKTDERFADWKYHRFEVHPDDLPVALERLLAAGFLGVNLTVPHKIIAFDRVAGVSPAARPIGAVNTLVRKPDGWHGHNTDGHGLTASLREDLSTELAGAEVLLLGAGGAARGAAVECMQSGVRSLRILNRTAATRDALIAQVRPLDESIPVSGIAPDDWSELPPRLVIINATSAGLKPDDVQPVDLMMMAGPRAVFDMIYNPAETRLLAQARALGIPAANGLGMLVHQGARSLQHWIEAVTAAGQPVPRIPVDVMRAAAEAALAAH